MTNLDYAREISRRYGPDSIPTWLTVGEYIALAEKQEFEDEAWKAAEWAAEQLVHNNNAPDPFMSMEISKRWGTPSEEYQNSQPYRNNLYPF